MILNEKQITLKDGRTAILRSPLAEDAAEQTEMIKKA